MRTREQFLNLHVAFGLHFVSVRLFRFSSSLRVFVLNHFIIP